MWTLSSPLLSPNTPLQVSPASVCSIVSFATSGEANEISQFSSIVVGRKAGGELSRKTGCDFASGVAMGHEHCVNVWHEFGMRSPTGYRALLLHA